MTKEKIKKDDIFRLTVKIDRETIAIVDKYAKKMKTNRSQLVRNLIDSGLDDIRLLECSGFLKMAMVGVDALDLVRKAFKSGSYKIQDDNKLVIDLQN